MGIWLLIAAAWGAPCADPAALVADAEQAVLEARWDDAWDLVDAVEDAFGCSPAASPELLARMWQAEGVLHASTGEANAADDAFAAASRVDPDQWNPDYGPAMKALFDATAGRSPVPVVVELRPPLERFVGLVDGVVTTAPFSVPAGLHLIQVGPQDEPMRFAKVVFLPPGEHSVIDHGVDETVPAVGAVVAIGPVVGPPPPDALTDPSRPPRKTPLLVAGGAALALGLGSAIAATTQNAAMTNAASVDSLEAAYGRQQAFGYAGYGLLGAGGALVGLYLVL